MTDWILPLLWSGIGAFCLAMATRGVVTGRPILPKGLKGTGLEQSPAVARMQIIALTLLGVMAFAFAALARSRNR